MSHPDIAIVGAGVVGCTIALRLARQGAGVTVFERGRPGAEASSAAAGILAPHAEADFPGPFFELARASLARYPDLARELRELTGIDIGYAPCGLVEIARDDAEATALEARAAWLATAGARVELLGEREARALEPSLAAPIARAAHLPDDHRVNTPLLARALYGAAAAAGAIFRTALVRGVVAPRGRAEGVDLGAGVCPAGAVVVAAGAWSSLLDGAGLCAPAVVPGRGQIVAFAVARPPFERVLMRPLAYLVPRADGRVLAGTTLEFVGFERGVTPEGVGRIVAAAAALVPALAKAPIAGRWSGFRPTTPDRLPLIGPTDVLGLFVATGHFRNGILLAPLTAEIVADLVSGRTPAWDLAPMSPQRFRPE